MWATELSARSTFGGELKPNKIQHDATSESTCDCSEKIHDVIRAEAEPTHMLRLGTAPVNGVFRVHMAACAPEASLHGRSQETVGKQTGDPADDNRQQKHGHRHPGRSRIDEGLRQSGRWARIVQRRRQADGSTPPLSWARV